MGHRSQSSPAAPALLSKDDAVAIARLFAACTDYFILQDGEAADMSDVHALFDDLPPGKDERDLILIGWWRAERLDVLAQIVRGFPADDIWYLGLLLVDPTMRGRGLGRRACATIEDWAAAQGAREIRLAVFESNQAALDFWLSSGFVERRRTGPDAFKQKRHYRFELSRTIDSARRLEGSRQ